MGNIINGKIAKMKARAKKKKVGKSPNCQGPQYTNHAKKKTD